LLPAFQQPPDFRAVCGDIFRRAFFLGMASILSFDLAEVRPKDIGGTANAGGVQLINLFCRLFTL
jgi:hypothetical protein